MKVRILLLVLGQLSLLAVLALLEPLRVEYGRYQDVAPQWMQTLAILTACSALTCLVLWARRRSDWLMLAAGLTFLGFPGSLTYRYFDENAKLRAMHLASQRNADWNQVYRKGAIEALEDYVAANPGSVSRPNSSLDVLELPGFADELARKLPKVQVTDGKIYDPWGCRLLPVQESGKSRVIRLPSDMVLNLYQDFLNRLPLVGFYVDHTDNLDGCQHPEIDGEHTVALREGRSGVLSPVPSTWQVAPVSWVEKNVLKGMIFEPQTQYEIRDGERKERLTPRFLSVPKYPAIVLEDDLISPSDAERIYRTEAYPLLFINGNVYTLATSRGLPLLRRELQIDSTQDLPYTGMVFRLAETRPTVLGVVLPDYVPQSARGPKQKQDLAMEIRLGVEGRKLSASVLRRAVWEDLTAGHYVVRTRGNQRMPSRVRVLWFKITEDGTFKPEAG